LKKKKKGGWSLKKQMISFSDPQYYALQNHANELGITFAELVRRVVDFYRVEFGLMGDEEMGISQDPAVEVWVENQQGKMVRSRIYHHDGCSYVEGIDGRRYLIRVTNPTMGRVETVVSVDGIDVHDGKQAATDKSGLVINPRGSYDFEGFRVSNEKVAAFRFGGVEGGYAAHKGDTSNVGVIGVAIYREQERMPIIINKTEITFQSDLYSAQPNWIGGWSGPARIPKGGIDSFRSIRRSSRSKGILSTQAMSSVEPSCTVASPAPQAATESVVSPALATEFGESRESKVGETTFIRKTSSPWRLFTIRYESRENLVKLGIVPDDSELQVREQASPFPGSTAFCEPPPGWGE